MSFFALPTCLHATTASPTQRRDCDHIVPVVVLRVAHPVSIRVVDAAIPTRAVRCQRAQIFVHVRDIFDIDILDAFSTWY